ncbi:TorD/DmsD family molecular chaperone [Maridesulfovibrio salexigens]|uniref:Cytoplasmic chaperone TorD family protein n=1 Tax=Maridesulfovibrio salexigens (strain ATCC 14822 / DSM 2638 / NCIMB 8403 / VKM B-1763) TaxID=526222 RepID=C6BWW4_MARSD|nr:molecular chaperone TorD family protein [Maridesulfovibrio salexigens]ACS78444.1 cytoplasmic chaperone TorD family protein [Maridesulfovibrio salexigens DSM 2638]
MTDKNTNTPTSEEENLDQVCLLNCIELCAIIFRGINPEECAALLDEGLPELATLSTESLQSLSGPLKDLQTSYPDVTDTFCAELESEYVRLFINSRDGIVAPLYESCYEPGSGRVMGESHVTMSKLLEEAGLAPTGEQASEPMDHLCIELEYLYVLLANGWGGNDEDSLKQARAFAAQKMVWVRKFNEKLADSDAIKFYIAASELLIAMLEEVTSS